MAQPGGGDTRDRTASREEEKTREARPGETGTTRFGMEEEDNETGGGGIESGLQPGGTTPGGGPGTGSGSIGTGGGSTANEDSRTVERWKDGELEESRR